MSDKPQPEGSVTRLPRSRRPEDALSWLSEALAGDDHGVRAVYTVLIYGDGLDRSVDARAFGEARRFDFSFVAALMLDEAVNGNFTD